MKLIGAVASHVGNVREVNQDRVFYRGVVAALADGMGGHQGGERAAELAIGEFEVAGQDLDGSDLVEVVQDANRHVHDHAADSGLAGMGTTVVALTLHENNTITVVNVGDSRAYWLRGDYLVQVTKDHSFVEDLVRQGRLTPEEAAIHPQRNILTRAVGIGAEVEVDRFPISEPMVGDRFLLCSDGLFNEIPETEIARILTKTVDPSDAAETLVTAALSTPCRDNVSVAVVDIVEDNDPAVVDRNDTGPSSRESKSRRSDENDTAPIPVVSTAVLHEGERIPESDGGGDNGVVTESVAESRQAKADSRNRAPTLLLDEEPVVEVDPASPNGDYEDPERYTDTAEMEAVDDPVEVTPRGGRKMLVLVGSVVALTAVAAGLYFGARTYARDGYFVEDLDGELSIYQGRRDGLLGLFEPVRIEETGIEVDDLNERELEAVADSEFSNRDDADNLVVAIRERQAAEEAEGEDGEEDSSDGSTLEDADASETNDDNTAESAPDATDTLTGSTTTGG